MLPGHIHMMLQQMHPEFVSRCYNSAVDGLSGGQEAGIQQWAASFAARMEQQEALQFASIEQPSINYGAQAGCPRGPKTQVNSIEQRAFTNGGSANRPARPQREASGFKQFGFTNNGTANLPAGLPHEAAQTGRAHAARGSRKGKSGQPQTTLLLQCLPLSYTRDMVWDMLLAYGFSGKFDFLYVPCDLATDAPFGYAFVNMVSPIAAAQCTQQFQGFEEWVVPSDRVCSVAPAAVNGLQANVKRFRNSPLMHESVSDEVKPILLASSGQRIPFPLPAKPVKAPKNRRLRDKAQNFDGNVDDGEQITFIRISL